MKVIYFSADWCQPCKTLKPIVQEVARETGTQIEYVNAEEQREYAQSLGVSSVPTLVGVNNGSVLFKHTGMTTKQQLISLFSKK